MSKYKPENVSGRVSDYTCVNQRETMLADADRLTVPPISKRNPLRSRKIKNNQLVCINISILMTFYNLEKGIF